VEEHSTNLKYTVNDCTGSILCTIYVDKDVEKTQLRVSSFVRVIGQLKEYQGSRYIGIFHIDEVSNMDELTHHLLEVGLTHLARTKGPIPGSSTGIKQASPAVMGGMTPMGMGGAYSGQRVVQNQQVNDLQQRIKNVLAVVTEESGLDIREITASLNRQGGAAFDLPAVTKALKDMSEQGAIYTTVDEEHYLLC